MKVQLINWANIAALIKTATRILFKGGGLWCDGKKGRRKKHQTLFEVRWKGTSMSIYSKTWSFGTSIPRSFGSKSQAETKYVKPLISAHDSQQRAQKKPFIITNSDTYKHFHSQSVMWQSGLAACTRSHPCIYLFYSLLIYKSSDSPFQLRWRAQRDMQHKRQNPKPSHPQIYKKTTSKHNWKQSINLLKFRHKRKQTLRLPT